MDKIKIAIIIILVVAVVFAVAAGVWYYKHKFYVPDKNGMVYSLTDTINSCRYESGDGMNGEYTSAKVFVLDNGEVWMKYIYRYPIGIDKPDIETEYRIDDEAIEKIREVCKKYGVLGWGKLKVSDMVVLDGATEVIELSFSDGSYYQVNTSLDLPDGGEKLFDEIFNIIKQYQQGDD